MNAFESILIAGARELGITLKNEQLALFTHYYRELMRWNAKMSLVSVKTSYDIPIKHFIDSLTVLPFVGEDKVTLLDIGSGAGFPGIPIKILRRSMKVCLVDSSRKKSSFLKTIVRTLNLSDVTVINERVENLAEDFPHRRNYDVVISRASLKLPRFIATGAPFMSNNGILIAMKGKTVEGEIGKTEETIIRYGLHLTTRHTMTLPVTGDTRKILVFTRSSS